MSKLRPSLRSTNDPAPDKFDSLWMIRDSVERREGLIHGALRTPLGVCAIGAFFDDNPKLALDNGLIDEVAAYNDSIPRTVPQRERRNRVLRWLTAKLDTMRARVIPTRHPAKQRARKKAS